MLGFLGVLLAAVIVYILYFHYENIRAIYFAAKIPGPRALPIIGNGLLFVNNTSAGKRKVLPNFMPFHVRYKIRKLIISSISYLIENFDLICRLVKEYGAFFRVWLGPELNVVVSDPKDVEVSCFRIYSIFYAFCWCKKGFCRHYSASLCHSEVATIYNKTVPMTKIA